MHLLPERLLKKRRHFRKKEFLAYRKHVEFGLDFLSQHPELDERILRIVRCHHERNDGRGFPRGIRGDQIPALARYASLAYCFERLLRTHCESGKISPVKAIARLYKQRLLKLPEQLIVEFIHVLGMYPVGTVVELSSGELAIILEQNDSQRLFPLVAMITNAERKLLKTPIKCDLSKQKGTSNLSIMKGVDPQEFEIDLIDYRLQFFGKRVGIGPLSFRL
jgi:HD-GYP domain-containing protein (c-di-GMP phosphodiesterase class II)